MENKYDEIPDFRNDSKECRSCRQSTIELNKKLCDKCKSETRRETAQQIKEELKTIPKYKGNLPHEPYFIFTVSEWEKFWQKWGCK